MIANLRDTTRSNKEQDWLKTNLAKFTGMMQGQRNIESLSKLIMSELTPVVSAQHGAFFVMENEPDQSNLKLISTYAYQKRKQVSNRFALGESLVGQCALEKKSILITDVPENYIHVGSGLGSAPPRNILVLPVLFEGRVKAIIELASFQEFSPIHLTFLDQLMQSIGVVFNMIGAGMRTEELLQELQRSNAQLEGRSKELEDKALQLEVKNREIAKASASLEEKAKELSQISKYKSDFLANMSHELRTPLNSLLILAKMLSDNDDKTLPGRAVEFAKTIYTSGHDLLALINEILDLSKIEAGKMKLETKTFPLLEVKGYVERAFSQIAKQKNLEFSVRIASDTSAVLTTDIQRLQQILKNLLSNAFKFTDRGHVFLDMHLVHESMAFKSESLLSTKKVLAFTVSDTGIGIPEDKQQLIFEAFQQADTTTARRYGGTGLGLTISRELARLLGGEIWLKSIHGSGSTFTLFLPLDISSFSNLNEDYITRIESISPFITTSEIDQPKTQEISSVDLSEKKILLIDDDQRNLFAVTSLLESQGAEVLTAENAKEGIEILQKDRKIHLVLMDIMMPEMDGYQATQEIRKMPKFESLPIIALTAKAMQEDRQKSINFGCTDFIPKPVENEKLLMIIQQWIDKN
jgi:signal transduction histidine kinase/ActR/RegA family two-component response regulator